MAVIFRPRADDQYARIVSSDVYSYYNSDRELIGVVDSAKISIYLYFGCIVL